MHLRVLVSMLHHFPYRLFIYLCLVAKGKQGPRVVNRWWQQKALDLVGMRMVDWEAEQMKGEEKMDETRIERYKWLSGSKL